MIIMKLGVVMEDRRIHTDKKLHEMTGVALNTIGKHRKGEVKQIDFEVLNKYCAALRCSPGDIIKYIPENEKRT